MIIKATIDGKEQEFRVLGWGGHGATHIITAIGLSAWGGGKLDGHGLLLRLINKQHTFGGLVFEETGEDRVPGPDEWWLGGVNTLYPGLGGTHKVQSILRHICEGITEEE